MKPGYMALEAVYTPNSTVAQRLDLPLRELPKGTAKIPTQNPQAVETPPPVRRRRVYRDYPSGEPLRQTPPPKSGDMIIFR